MHDGTGAHLVGGLTVAAARAIMTQLRTARLSARVGVGGSPLVGCKGPLGGIGGGLVGMGLPRGEWWGSQEVPGGMGGCG